MQKHQLCAVIGTIVILACLFLGCAGTTGTTKYSYTATTTYITSDPEGAEISLNDEQQGKTPLTVKVTRRYTDVIGGSNTFIFKAEKEGYRTTVKRYNGAAFQKLVYVIPGRLHFSLKPEGISTDTKPFVKKKDVQKKSYLAKHDGRTDRKFEYNMISGSKWAVVIGISEYHDTRIPSLRYAAADAKAFYNWIISSQGGKYAPSRVKLLLNRGATGKNIKNSLFVWLKQAIEEDLVTIYFAGHGSPESPDSQNNLFLFPYDTQYDNIASTGFPMWDIETALKRFIKAKKVIVIADACHSGGVGQSFDIARRAARGIKVNPISSGLQRLSQIGDGVCVISASDDKQFSQEDRKWGGGHGVFTYFLLKGLKGDADYSGDGRVTLGELIPYLSEQVRRETRNVQYPTVAGKFDPALSIAR